MSTQESLVAEADELRTRKHRPRQAIRVYAQAFNLDGALNLHCLHMMGVCHGMLHEYEIAEAMYQDALKAATTDEQQGNIQRDRAGAFMGRDWLGEAWDCIQQSLKLLPYDLYPAAHAATLGFQARLLVKLDRLPQALDVFKDADRKLAAAGAHKPRLYSLLHWASALSRAGEHDKCRRTLARAMALIPEHGSRQHSLRAQAILHGGWRADAMLSRARDAATWLYRLRP